MNISPLINKASCVVVFIATAASFVAHSQSQESVAACDCSVVTGECRGEVTQLDGQIEVSSNARQCARVTWRANEDSFVTIVSRRRETVEQADVSQNAELSVSSCEVCQIRRTSESAGQPRPSQRPRAADDISQKPLNNCNDQIEALRGMLARSDYENPIVRSRCTQLRNNCPAAIVGEVAVRRFTAVCEGNASASSLIRGR